MRGRPPQPIQTLTTSILRFNNGSLPVRRQEAKRTIWTFWILGATISFIYLTRCISTAGLCGPDQATDFL
jgi:hypothetical protein